MIASDNQESVLPEAAVRTLLGPGSATAALGRWFADEPVMAQVFAGASAAVPDKLAIWLRPERGETIGYRRVQLVSSGAVLSDAEIWFRPGMLAPDMQRALAETDTPFGAVVAPLAPQRIALSAVAAPLRIEAMLRVAGATLAVVREAYHEAALLAGWRAQQEIAARAA